MPAWLEILINLIGYGGFIAIAMYHRPPGKSCRCATRAKQNCAA
jgi:hypothetical protein